jgi:hypothetical protein
MHLSLIHVARTHAVHRYHTIVAIRDFSLAPPRISICRSDIAVSRKRDRDTQWCVSNAKRGKQQSRVFLQSRFAHFRRVPFPFCSVPFRSVPRHRAYIRPRTFDLRGLDGIPWMRNVIPYTTPLAPRLFSRPVTSGHITIPRPMWNFAFQSCPPSNKRRQLPTGNIFSAKGWAIYLERKRLDTSGSTEESESTRISWSSSRKIRGSD